MASPFQITAAQRGTSPFSAPMPLPPTVPAEGWMLLDTIAKPESGGHYDVRYTPEGGARFTGTEHPRIYEKGPHGPSSAAGRYQFTATTWDDMGGGSFTPDNQDAMAWKLAQDVYSRKMGRDLLSDLQTSGVTQPMLDALSDTWQGLKKAQAPAAVLAQQMGPDTGNQPPPAGGPLGTPAQPSPAAPAPDRRAPAPRGAPQPAPAEAPELPPMEVARPLDRGGPAIAQQLIAQRGNSRLLRGLSRGARIQALAEYGRALRREEGAQ